MEIHRRRVHTLVSLAMAGGVLGCASGSESVPIPGADAVVTAPVASLERPPAADPATTEAPAIEESEASAPSTSDVATTLAPTPTEAPTPLPATTAAPPATTTPVDIFLRLGDEGPEVELMQFKLSVLEYLPAGSDTGVFDEATRSGLRQFQADYGLGVDGIFGPITGRSLNAAVQSVAVES